MKPFIILFSLATSTLLAQNPTQPSVNVSGEGIVLVVPDMVSISVEVVNEGDDVRTVKSENDKAVNKVLEFLENSGIDKKDYKTQYVNLRKQYDYNTKEYKMQASQSISILLKDIKKYDAIMQGLLESGVNQINGVNFEVSDKSKYYTEVRKQAVLEAQQKAKEYAEALGQNIGKAIQITDTYVNPFYPMNNSTLDEVTIVGYGASKTAPTLMTGTLAIKSQVNVSFELK